MRIIRTELYFNDVEHEYKIISDDYNVDFTFLPGEVAYPVDEILTPIIQQASNRIDRFIDMVVQGTVQRQFAERIYADTIINRHIVDFIKSAGVVIEQSPPEAIPFASLLRKASSVTIGTMMGAAVALDNPPLMFITIPAGIIVVGSAMGVSKGLERGLAKKIERLMKRK
jgi:hypothetical protein